MSKLEEILLELTSEDTPMSKIREAIAAIIAMVPKEVIYEMDALDGGYDEIKEFNYKQGWNACLEELLKNIGAEE